MIGDISQQDKSKDVYFTPVTIGAIEEWVEYDLVLTEVKVLSLIRILSHKNGSTWVLNKYISEKSGVSIRAVENAISSLAEKGLITRKFDRRKTVVGKFEVDRQLAPVSKSDRVFVPEAGVSSPDHLPHSGTDPLKFGSPPPEGWRHDPPNQNVDRKKEILNTEAGSREEGTISIPPISPGDPSVAERPLPPEGKIATVKPPSSKLLAAQLEINRHRQNSPNNQMSPC